MKQKLRVDTGDNRSWHVFNGKCQVAGPYHTKEQAESVRDEMEKTET